MPILGTKKLQLLWTSIHEAFLAHCAVFAVRPFFRLCRRDSNRIRREMPSFLNTVRKRLKSLARIWTPAAGSIARTGNSKLPAEFQYPILCPLSPTPEADPRKAGIVMMLD